MDVQVWWRIFPHFLICFAWLPDAGPVFSETHVASSLAGRGHRGGSQVPGQGDRVGVPLPAEHRPQGLCCPLAGVGEGEEGVNTQPPGLCVRCGTSRRRSPEPGALTASSLASSSTSQLEGAFETVALQVSGFVSFQFDSEGVSKALISGGGWEARRVVCWHFCETLLRVSLTSSPGTLLAVGKVLPALCTHRRHFPSLRGSAPTRFCAWTPPRLVPS